MKTPSCLALFLFLMACATGQAFAAGDGAATVSPDTAAHMLFHATPPVYPPDAKEKKIQGAVILHAIIDTGGNVTNLRVVRAKHPELVQAALDAVGKWQYHPYLLNGVPTPVETTITVNFVLSGSKTAPSSH